MSNIFISHSSEDNNTAKVLQQKLKEWGHTSIFLDVDRLHGIKAGTDWKTVLYSKLRTCQAVIVLCSYASMGSRWVFAEVAIADFQGKQLFPIMIGDLKDRELFSMLAPTQFFKPDIEFSPKVGPDYEGLRIGLREARLENAFIWDGKRPPYPGLTAFEEKDAPLFFGRHDDIQAGAEQLRSLRNQEVRLLMYLGASGSGKSSLVRAGLVPQLKKAVNADDWIVVSPFRPINEGFGDPFENLAAVLSEAFEDCDTSHDADTLQQQLMTTQPRHGLLTVARTLATAKKHRKATVLIIIDQFEELLGKATSGQAEEFLDWLGEGMVAAQKSPAPIVMILATIRSDFLPAFQQCLALHPVETAQKLVSPISVSRFGELIEGPAKLVGLCLEPGLTQQIVSDAKTENALPLLAFTLEKLQEQYGGDGRLKIEEYNQLGKLTGAVSQAAQRIFDDYIASEKLEKAEGESLLRQALLKLVRLDKDGKATRRLLPLQELPIAAQPLIEKFVEGRLLTTSVENKLIAKGHWNSGDVQKLVEVSHEALFTEWRLLREWIDDSREYLIQKQKIEATAEEWQSTNQPKSMLLIGKRLETAVEFMAITGKDFPLNMAGQAFVAVSQQANEAKVFFQQTRSMTRGIATPLKQSFSLVAIARAEATAGATDDAQDTLEQALTIAQRAGAPEEQGQMLAEIALASRQLYETDYPLDRIISVANGSGTSIAAIAQATNQWSDSIAAKAVLEKTTAAVENINHAEERIKAWSAIAQAYRQLDPIAAKTLLEKATTTMGNIDFARNRSTTLSALAQSAGQLSDSIVAKAVLDKTTAAAKNIDDAGHRSTILSDIAQAAGQLSDSIAAKAVLDKTTAAAKNIDNARHRSTILSDIAQAAGQLSNPIAAKAVLDQTTAAAENIDNSRARINVLSSIAQSAGQLSDPIVAKAVLEKVTIAVGIIDHGYYYYARERSTILSDIAQAYCQLSDPIAAKAVLEKATIAVSLINSGEGRSRALSDITQTAGQLSDPIAAKVVLGQATAAAKNIDLDRFRSKPLSDIAQAYCQLSDPTTAKALLEKAIAAGENMYYATEQVKALSDIAQAYGQLSDPIAAKALLAKATAAAQNMYHAPDRIKALSDIAQAYDQLSDPIAAKALLAKATAAVENINNTRDRSKALSDIAQAYDQLSDPIAAKALLEKAIAAAENIDDTRHRIRALSKILKVQEDLGLSETLLNNLPNTPSQIKGFLDTALTDVVDNPQRSKYSRHKALIEITQVLRQFPDIDSAKALLDKALSLAQALRLSEYLGPVFNSLAVTYGHITQWNEALHTLKHCTDDEKTEALTQILDLWVEHYKNALLEPSSSTKVESQ